MMGKRRFRYLDSVGGASRCFHERLRFSTSPCFFEECGSALENPERTHPATSAGGVSVGYGGGLSQKRPLGHRAFDL